MEDKILKSRRLAQKVPEFFPEFLKRSMQAPFRAERNMKFPWGNDLDLGKSGEFVRLSFTNFW